MTDNKQHKQRPCSYNDCKHHRVHWCSPDKPRGEQMVEVSLEYPDTLPVYCSMTCALLDGWAVLYYETQEEQKTRQNEWLKKRDNK